MVEIKNENGVYTASFEGRLDSSAAKDVEDEIDGLLAHADKEIVLDCTKLEYISSMGLRLFLRIRKEVSAKGGQVSILNINKDVKNVFAMTGFDIGQTIEISIFPSPAPSTSAEYTATTRSAVSAAGAEQ